MVELFEIEIYTKVEGDLILYYGIENNWTTPHHRSK